MQQVDALRFWRVRMAIFPAAGTASEDQGLKQFDEFLQDLNRILEPHFVSPVGCMHAYMHVYAHVCVCFANDVSEMVGANVAKD